MANEEEAGFKKCSSCGNMKPLSDFYRRGEKGHSKDGHIGRCVECMRTYSKAWEKTNRKLTEAKIGAIKRWQRNNTNKRMQAKGRWRERNKEEYLLKARVMQAVYRAIKDGTITKPDRCERCGRDRTILQAHHEDYEKPLEVEWLCVSCHGLMRKRKGDNNGKIGKSGTPGLLSDPA